MRRIFHSHYITAMVPLKNNVNIRYFIIIRHHLLLLQKNANIVQN